MTDKIRNYLNGNIKLIMIFIGALLLSNSAIFLPAMTCAQDNDENVYAEDEGGPQWDSRLLDVKVEHVDGQLAVKVKTTKKVKTSVSYLKNPSRMLMKVHHTLLTWKPTILNVGQGSLKRIRAAQHDDDVWVVFDMAKDDKWDSYHHNSGVILTLRDGQKPSRIKKANVTSKPVEQRPATSYRPISNQAAMSKAAYQVVDVSAENLGAKTKLVITTDGLARYKVERDKDGNALTVTMHDAALSWRGRLAGLPVGAVKRVYASVKQAEQAPVVVVRIGMTRPSSYVVFKDQNQVIVEFNNPDVIDRYAGRRGNLDALVSVDLENADLASVCRALAQDVKFDLVLSPGVQQLDEKDAIITLTINQQPFRQVLDFILRPRKLAYAVSGNTLKIGLAQEFSTETQVFTLKNTDINNANIKESIETALTEGSKSKVVVDHYGNRVIVSAIPSDMRRVRQIINRMDVERRLVTKTFMLNYTNAEKIIPMLKPQLSTLGSIKENKSENALVITDIPGNMSSLGRTIRSLDTKMQQVMIEARIVEVSRTNETDLGISWSVSNYSTNPTYSARSYPDTVSSVGRLSIGSVQSGVNISAVLSAMESKGMVNTISNPRIATVNKKEASLKASQSIPYVSSVVSNGVVSRVVEYLELPINLTVTPQITKGNQVLLNPLTLTVTTPVGDASPPATTTRSASTQMLVKDGETIAIGGMVRDEEETSESKVPLLGDLPLLGFLFRSNVTTKNKIELVVFLTPHILE